MSNELQKIREGIADRRYRSDYSSKELKEFIDLPVYLQNLYLTEADEILEFLADKDMAIPSPYSEKFIYLRDLLKEGKDGN